MHIYQTLLGRISGGAMMAAIILAGCAPTTLAPTTTTIEKFVCSLTDMNMQKTEEPNSMVPSETQVYQEPGVPGTAYCSDNGKTFNIWITSRLSVVLNAAEFPHANVIINCSPEAAIGSVSNLPVEPSGYYVVRYEGVKPGTCTIQNGHFAITVNVVEHP